MKKIARQETASVRKPPSTGPIASASAETPAQVPIAIPRCLGGKALVTIDRVAGIIRAPPTPWTTRLTTSDIVSGASPAVAEEREKSVTPIRKVKRRPKMSPRRPPVASSTAKASV